MPSRGSPEAHWESVWKPSAGGLWAPAAAVSSSSGRTAPSLTPWSIDESLRRLRSADVVIGPSVDGGYYLIGLRAEALPSAAPAVFQGIEWGTGRVLEQTLAALPGGLRLSLMPPWYDVDVPEEAAFLRVHLEALARSGDDTTASHSRAALRGLDLPPPGYRPMMR